MNKRETGIKAAQKIYLKCRQIKEDILFIRKLAESTGLSINKHVELMDSCNHVIHDLAREQERILTPEDEPCKDEREYALRQQALMRARDD